MRELHVTSARGRVPILLIAGLALVSALGLAWAIAVRQRALAGRQAAIRGEIREGDELVQLRHRNRRLREQVRRLAGESAVAAQSADDRAAAEAARERYRLYGDIAGEKVAVVEELRKDYAARLKAELEANGTPNLRAIRASEQAAIREALTAEEYFEYQLRHSAAGRRGEDGTRGLVLTDAEFRDLVRLELEWEEAMPPDEDPGRMIAARPTLDLKLITEGRRLLGDARFRTFLRETRGEVAMIAEVLDRHPEVPPSALFELHLERLRALAQFRAAVGPAGEDRTADPVQMQAELAQRARLLVGPEVVADLEKTRLAGFAKR